MTYEMPVLTEEQRKTAIARCHTELSLIEQALRYIDMEDPDRKLVEGNRHIVLVALATLTA